MGNEKDYLSKSFDIEPISNEPSTSVQVFPEDAKLRQFEEFVDADYAFARENIMTTIVKAQDSLDQIMDLAQASQMPRAYEVVSTLMKTIVDANKDLLDLAKKNKELRQVERQTPGAPVAGTITNNLFVGSTDELQKFIRSQGIDTGLKTIEVVPVKKEE